MDTSDKKLVCLRCKVAPELVREKGQRDIIRCSRCGVFGDREEVIRAAAQHVARKITDDLQDRLARSTSLSKNVRYLRGNRKGESTPAFVFQ